MPKAVISKRWFAILVMALLIVISAATMAFLTDRVDHTMQFTTASFNADTYKLTRTAPVGPFCAGEQVTATLKESNAGSDDVNSVISMKATWVSPDAALSIFGNADAADNAKLAVGGTNVDYTVSADKKSITFNLPEHVLEAGAANKSRDLTLTIPESFKSTGHIEFTFDKVVVTPVSGGFTNEYSRTELNASSQLDFSAKVGWAASSITAQNGKALMGYLTGKNAAGKYGIEFELAFGYTSSPMKDFAARTDAKWSYYKGAVDTLTFVEGMTSIGDYAFPDFTGVKAVSFPATVRTIGVSAFDASGLTGTVTIPATVKELRSLAFGNLPNVKTFTFGHGSGDTLTLPDNTAAGKRNTGAFYVPTHVDTTVNSSVEAIQYGYKWHDGYDNRRLVPTLNAKDAWFRTDSTAKLDEEKLQTITFADYHMPVTGETSWDASDPSVPGTVTAYLSADKTSLILAGNGYGLVFANKDSSDAFSNLPALKTVSNTDLLDTRNATTMADMFNFDQKLANISVSTWNVSKVENMSNMFYSCDSLPSIDLKKNTCTAKDGSGTYIAWNTSALKNTGGMFMDYGGPKHSLTTVDTTGWDTSKLETADYMFMECRGLTEVKGIESWNVSSLKDAHNMFQDCQSLESINVANWKTTSLENASVMFSSCHSLRSIDISKWDMSKVTKSNAMFSYCKSFVELTIPESLVVIGSYFAGNCPKLTTITFNHPAGTDIQFSSEAFYIYNNDKAESDAGYIEYTPVKPLGTRVVTSNQKVLDYDWTSDHRGYVVEIKAVEGGTLTGTPLASYNGRKAVVAINGVTVKFTTTPDADYSYEGATIQYSQNGVTKTVTLDKNTKTWVMPVVDDKVAEADVVVTPKWTVSARPMLAKQDSWQYNGTDTNGDPTTPIDYDLLETINIVNKYTPASGETSWDASANETVGGTVYTGKVTAYLSADKKTLTIAGNGYGKIFANPDSEWAFTKAYDGMPALKKISGAEVLDTQLMVKAGGMFAQNRNLESVNVSNWNTGKLQNTSAAGGYYGMFMNCAKLKALDVSGWNTGNVTETVRMFAGCSLLTTIDVSGWKTAKITNMNEMFSGTGISRIAVNGSGWDTSNLVYSYGMFEDCANLTEIDLSTWNVSKLEKAFSMFENSGLKSIDLSTWDESIVNSVYDMFRNCKALTSVNLNGWNLSHMENGTTDDRKGSAGMFSGCTALTKLTIPASLTMFGQNFAANCTSLTTIEFLHDAGTALTFPTAGSTYGAFYVPSYLATNVVGSNASAQGYDWVTDNRKLEMISVPAQIGTLTYNGNAQSPTWNSNYEPAKMTMSGVTSGVNAGSYIAKFTPKTGYIWTDGTTATKSVTWKIGKAPGSLTLSRSAATIDYNASTTTFTVTRAGDGEISVTSRNTNVAAVSISGNTVTVTKKAPGVATITVSVAEGTNHLAPADKACAITCIGSLTVPSQKGTLTYTGSSQTPSWNNYDSTKMTMSGTTSGTNARSYTATFTPKTYYKWSDGTSGAKSVTWKIGKAPGSLTLSKTEETVLTSSASFTVTRAGDGAISVKSGDATIATATVSGNTVKVTKRANGTAVITVSVVEGTNYLAPADATYTVTFKSEPTLAPKNTWYKGSVKGYTITDVSFVDRYTPTGAEDESWDASAAQDKSVMAYRTGTKVVVAGDGSGSIYANKDSSEMFCFYECDRDAWPIAIYDTQIASIQGLELLDTSHVTNMSYMFLAGQAYDSKASPLTEIEGISGWDTSNVTNMRGMFEDCANVTSLDVSKWNTSKVTDMASMFRSCSGLTSLDVTKFDTSKVTDMARMFSSCSGLTSLDVTKFDTSKVTNMSGMFSACEKLTRWGDLSGWDTSQVTNMDGMFSYCYALTSEEAQNKIVKYLDTDNVEYMGHMFSDCTALTTLDLTGFNTAKVKNMNHMFYMSRGQTSLLSSLDLSGWDTSNVQNARLMFSGCRDLANLNISGWNMTSKLYDIYEMFEYCSSLVSLDLSGWNTSGVGESYVKSVFGDCNKLQKVTLGKDFVFKNNALATANGMALPIPQGEYIPGAEGFWFDTEEPTKPYNTWDVATVVRTETRTYVAVDPFLSSKATFGSESAWYKSNINKSTITKITFLDRYTPTGSEDESWDASLMQNGSVMAYRTGTQIIVAGNGSGEIYMSRLSQRKFWNFDNLKTIAGINLLDTSMVVNMANMFDSCFNLTGLDVSKFNTSNVTDMTMMFYECRSLTSLDVSKFDTSKVTKMNGMFYDCVALSKLNLLGWDTSKVTDMGAMFGGWTEGCKSLTSLDLSGWDTSKVTNMENMFNKCPNLRTIYVSDLWSTESVTASDNMFQGCSALRGKISYNSSKTDATYADYNTGYLTYKAAPTKTAARAMSIMSSGSEISGYSVSE